MIVRRRLRQVDRGIGAHEKRVREERVLPWNRALAEEPGTSLRAAGFERDTVLRVDRMLNLAEYKRRQAAPGVKVTLRNFGRDRRYPITNFFHTGRA